MITAPYKNHDHAPEVEQRARSENFVRAAIATLQAIVAVAFVFGVLWLANWLTPPFKPEPYVEPRPEVPAAPQFVHDRLCGKTT